jgi:two-component system, LytTR family, response regulator
MGYSAIIIDDDESARLNLSSIFKNYFPEIEVLAMAASAIEARKQIIEFEPQVIFIDINMPGMSGIEFLNTFHDRKFLAIIVSAESNHGISAVKANAFDYLIKPISFSELQETITKIVKHYSSQVIQAHSEVKEKRIALPTSNGFTYFDLNEITLFKGEDSYTTVVLATNKEIMITKTLKYFETTLPHSVFIRIHKSHIINILHVKEYNRGDGGFVVLSNGKKYEISKNKLQSFLSLMNDSDLTEIK